MMKIRQIFSEGQVSTLLAGIFAACYLAVLPMANTIALRNVALLALSLCLAWHFLRVRPSVKWMVPLVLSLWGIYLGVFPLIADSSTVAMANLAGQWGRGVWAMLVGAGVAAIFYNKNRGATFYLGLVSAVPILVHLYLFIEKGWATSSIPWGYWGRETHHADLGYAAGQTIVLLAAAVAAGSKASRPWAVALIVASIMSTALAYSRAGLVFSVLGGVLVFGAAYLARSKQRHLPAFAGLVGILLVGAGVLAVVVKEDDRWQNMAAQLEAGFLGDAIQIQCEGTSSVESKIISLYGPGQRAQSVIASVRGGDGSRVVLFRAGLALALKHPLGSDGSRQAFQKLLRQECANPAISMAHTHNGWLDTMLALGWAGAVLYLSILLYFFWQGFSYLRREKTLNEWALVLAALPVFWILRGLTDSIFRDHMLEMQGFALAYAATAMKLQTQEKASSHTAQFAPQATPHAG